MSVRATSERVYDWLLRHRRLALSASLTVPLVLAAFVPTDFETSLRIWFLDDDPDVLAYDAFKERFPQVESVAVAIEAEDVFSTEFLGDLERLTEALEGLHPDARASSLANAETVERVGDTLSIRPLIEQIPRDAAELEALRRRVHDDVLISPLVSSDDRAALVLLETPPTELPEKVALARSVRAVCQRLLPDRTFHLGGHPFLDEAAYENLFRDLVVFATLTLLVVLLSTIAVFRSFWSTAVPTAVVLLTVASMAGVAGLLGIKMNMLTTVIVPLCLAVGVAGCVHLIEGYRQRLRLGMTPPQALRSAWLELLLPCFITTVTTAGGLCALLASKLAPLRQFGGLGALTVVFALIHTLVLVPVVFSYVVPFKVPDGKDDNWMNRLLRVVSDTAWRRRRLVVGGVALLCALATLGLTRLQLGGDFTRWFGEDDPVFLDSRFIDDHLGGAYAFEVLVEAPDVRDLEVLSGFEALESFFDGFEAIQVVFSPATLLKVLHESFFGDPRYYCIPASLAACAQLLLQMEGTDLHQGRFSLDYSVGRLTARLNATRYRELQARMDESEALVASTFSGEAHGQITGSAKLWLKLDPYILGSQLRSFPLAFAAIGLLICALFRSLRVGLWALFPNLVPILVVLGTMGWASVPLDPATIMVASIMLGIVVDDTVHFLARFGVEEARAESRGEPNPMRVALLRTGLGTGRAIVTTSLILALSFWTCLFSRFAPDRSFGLMSGVAVLIALGCDLVLLPAVMRLMPMRRWARRPSKLAQSDD